MKLAKKLKNIQASLIRSMQLQLFITLLSIPLLTYWGIPLSIVSPIGNLVFGPFLMIFLLLSSIIFFFELVYIPNKYLIFVLEKFTAIWMKIISYANTNWLIHLFQTSLVYSIIFIVIVYLVIHHKKLLTPKISLAIMTLIFCLHYIYLEYLKTNVQPITTFTFCNKEITFIKSRNKTALVDPGALCSRISAPSFVQFELLPNLIKMGIKSIDHVIILKPTVTILKTLDLLCQIFQIKNIYLITWTGRLSPKRIWIWQKFMRTIKEFNIRLFRIKNDLIHIRLDDQQSLVISPQDKKIKNNKIFYPEVKVVGILDDKNLQIKSI